MLIYLISLVNDENEREKFTAIYRQYHNQMGKVDLRVLAEQKDAEDAVQNAWIQVIKHFQKVSEIPGEELLFWLISITKNEALMILRTKRNTTCFEEWDSVTEATNGTLDYQELVALFAKLPTTYRATLEMKFLLQYTDHEISQHLGISETAVSTRVSRGRSLLRDLVIKEGLLL